MMERAPLPEHTVNRAAANTAPVNHLLWRRSLSETFRGATFCQRMRYLEEVIATVVSVTLGRLLTSWNMMRADSQGGKMASDSHLWIYHLQTRRFGTLSCVAADPFIQVISAFVQFSVQRHWYISCDQYLFTMTWLIRNNLYAYLHYNTAHSCLHVHRAAFHFPAI